MFPYLFCRTIVVPSLLFMFYGAFYGYELPKNSKRTVKLRCEKRSKNGWIISGSRNIVMYMYVLHLHVLAEPHICVYTFSKTTSSSAIAC